MNQPRDLADIRIDLSCCRARHACALCMFLLVCTPLGDATSSLAHFNARHVVLAQPVSAVRNGVLQGREEWHACLATTFATSFVPRESVSEDESMLARYRIACNMRSLTASVCTKQDVR